MSRLQFWLQSAARSRGKSAVTLADEADNRLSAQAVQRQLADAIADLTPADREVLLLIAWADLSYPHPLYT